MQTVKALPFPYINTLKAKIDFENISYHTIKQRPDNHFIINEKNSELRSSYL
jgi:hypothetical protein